MEKMGRYCKAYPIARFREYANWSEDAANTRKERKQVDGNETEVNRELTDDSFLYLQEDYTVTDGIYTGKNVIFQTITPEWVNFCKNNLKFEIPDYLSEGLKSDSEAASQS
jgi:hypothetical protein